MSIKSPLLIQRDEHDETLLAKKTSLVSAATVYAVVNTAAAGQSSIVLDDSIANIGFATVNVANTVPVTFSGNVTLDDGSLTGIVGNVTLSDSKGFIGLTSVSGFANPLPVSFSGNVTLDDGSLTGITGNVTLSDAKTYVGLTTSTLGLGTATIGKVGALQETSPWVISATDLDIRDLSATQDNVAIKGNMTLSDSKAFIGLVSVSGFANPLPVSFSGNVTLDDGSLTGIVGNVTLSDSKTFIGLTTTTLGASPAYIGLVTVANTSLPVTFSGNITLDDGSLTGIVGNVTLSDSKGFIGLTSVSGFANPLPVTFSGNVTLDDGSLTGIVGNVTLSDAKTFIGLTTTTLGASPAFVGIVTIANTNIRAIAGNVTLSDAKTYIGLVTNTPVGLSTVIQGTSPWSSSIVGNLTLSDAKTFIGLTTNVQDFGSNVTVHTAVYSATGNNTLFIAPASNRFWLTNLHVASLGRAELEIRSGATTLIPFTALSTTAGYAHNFVPPGLPSRAQADALVVNLNGAATISIMASWYARA